MEPQLNQEVIKTAAAHDGPIETDAVVVGAGPIGLFQVFELGLLEIKAHVIDALGYPGGQCVELYPDKPIYDIPALPVCTGQELTDNLLKQIEPFGATFHFGQEVTVVQRQEDGRFFVQTSRDTKFLTKTLFIAAGVGDSALDWALNFAAEGPNKAESVILIHRRDGFKAAPASVAKMHQLCDAHEMQFIIGQVTGCEEKDGRLSAVKVTGSDGVTRIVPLDVLLVFFGLSPKLGPIAEWGLDIERKQLKVDTEKFATNTPGIFAVGDINTYPGKKKLILSGFHECALAAFGAAPLIFPDKKIMLQYTTTSPKLHKVLGVESPVFD